MPWDASSFRKHNRKLRGPRAAKAAAIANAVLAKSGDEGKAIRIANSKFMDHSKHGLDSVKG